MCRASLRAAARGHSQQGPAHQSVSRQLSTRRKCAAYCINRLQHRQPSTNATLGCNRHNWPQRETNAGAQHRRVFELTAHGFAQPSTAHHVTLSKHDTISRHSTHSRHSAHSSAHRFYSWHNSARRSCNRNSNARTFSNAHRFRDAQPEAVDVIQGSCARVSFAAAQPR